MDYFAVKSKSKKTGSKSKSMTKSKSASKSKSGSKSKSASKSGSKSMSMMRKHKNKIAGAAGIATFAALLAGAKKFEDKYKVRPDQAHNRLEIARQMYRGFRLFPKKDKA